MRRELLQRLLVPMLLQSMIAVANAYADASDCGLPNPAFCETFDSPDGNGNRSGDLNGTLWGVSRQLGAVNFGQGQYYDVAASPQALSESLIDATDELPVRRRLLKHAKEYTASSGDARTFLLELRSSVRRVVVRPEMLIVEIERPALRAQLRCADEKTIETDAAAEPIVLTIASHLYRTGHDLRMVITDDETTQAGKRDIKLLRLIARGRRWYKHLTSGEMPSLRAIARSEGLRDTYAARVFAGSLLAPDIIESVLAGRQPVTFTVDSLRTPPPLDWAGQRRTFGFPAI